MATGNTTNQQCIIIWLDSSANSSEENIATQQTLFETFGQVEIFENENDCQAFIRAKSKQSIVLIVSGRLSREITPAVHELEHVVAIYIYCMDKSRHEQWAQQFAKVVLR